MLSRLYEDSRSQLISKGRSGEREKGDSKTRYEKRVKSRVTSSTRQYNQINMNQLFKNNILTVNIEVKGETDDYIVTMSFGGFLDEIHDQLKRLNLNEINLRVITRALVNAFNSENVYIKCTCLHPDTVIKLLDGTSPTVSELFERFNSGERLFVYSVDANGDFKPGEVEKVWITGTSREFIKVTLDNGSEIITTPNHPYMLRDGSYLIAENLTAGLSLMPLYMSQTKNGYDTVKFNSTGKYHSVYKQVAENFYKKDIADARIRAEHQCTSNEKKMRYDVAIHHKDFNKHNNNPENLDVMTSYEHWCYHSLCSFDNKPKDVQDHIRRISRENAIKRNANPTPHMLECRKKFVDAGKNRNYDLDRKQQQAEIMRNTMKNYYENISDEDKLNLHNIRSLNTHNAWENSCFDTVIFTEAAKKRGDFLRSDNLRELSVTGIKNYWNTISYADREIRKNISQENIKKANDKVRGSKLTLEHRAKISESRLKRSPEAVKSAAIKCNKTKIKNNLQYLIDNNLALTLENYNLYKKNGSPNISPTFDTIDSAVKYFELNHKVTKVERIFLDNTPVYDIKVKDWNNFAVEGNVILHNCPDWKYRMNYWATKSQLIINEPENRPSRITNPSNKLGPGCKHVMLVLSNHSWLIKVASVITNYINYMKQHYEKQYATIIYPALYEKEYKEPVQLDIFDDNQLDTGTSTLDKSNIEAQKKGQFKPGNKYRYTKQADKNQPTIDEIESETEIEETPIEG